MNFILLKENYTKPLPWQQNPAKCHSIWVLKFLVWLDLRSTSEGSYSLLKSLLKREVRTIALSVYFLEGSFSILVFSGFMLLFTPYVSSKVVIHRPSMIQSWKVITLFPKKVIKFSVRNSSLTYRHTHSFTHLLSHSIINLTVIYLLLTVSAKL